MRGVSSRLVGEGPRALKATREMVGWLGQCTRMPLESEEQRGDDKNPRNAWLAERGSAGDREEALRSGVVLELRGSGGGYEERA